MRFLYGVISFVAVALLLGAFLDNGAQISDDVMVLSLVIGTAAGIASGE